jgi:hypothetical protein
MNIITERPPIRPFTIDFHGDEISVTTAQGLGDIYWAYQKLAPYFSQINFNIASFEGDTYKTATRAVDWMKCFPKVNQIQIKKIAVAQADALFHQYARIMDALEAYQRQEEVFYVQGQWLAEGVRLENIDPGSKIEWDFELLHESYSLPFSEYTILYVSGAGETAPVLKADHHQLWELYKYVELLEGIYRKYDKNWPVVILGAYWDKLVEEPLKKILTERGFNNCSVFEQHPLYVIDMIKNAKLYIGYQGGMSCIADQMGIPQIMLYYPHIAPMIFSWCKPQHIRNTYYGTTFANSPQKIVEELAFDNKSFKL